MAEEMTEAMLEENKQVKKTQDFADAMAMQSDGLFMVGDLERRIQNNPRYRDFADMMPVFYKRYVEEVRDLSAKLNLDVKVKTILVVEKKKGEMNNV